MKYVGTTRLPSIVGRIPVVALWFLLIAPNVLMAAKLSTSLALGTTAAALLAYVIGLLKKRGLPSVPAVAPWLAVLMLAIIVHLILASRTAPIDAGRALGSMLLLAIVGIGAASLADQLTRVPPARLRLLARHAIWLFLAIGAWGCVGFLQPFGGIYSKPVFPFTEPSHFGLFLAPVLIAACAVSSPRERMLLIGIALAETAVLQNVTMAAACLLAAITCLPPKQLLILALIAVPGIALLDLSYYLTRLDFSEENSNLSTLVYLQGWQMLDSAWDSSGGFGLGFQQLGINSPDVDATILIRLLAGDDLNLLDGGFNMAKLLAEFGVFGVALLAAYAVTATRSMLLLRAAMVGQRKPPLLQLLAASSILGYSVELVLRGAGYFTPTGLLMVTALILWKRCPWNARN